MKNLFVVLKRKPRRKHIRILTKNQSLFHFWTEISVAPSQSLVMSEKKSVIICICARCYWQKFVSQTDQNHTGYLLSMAYSLCDYTTQRRDRCVRLTTRFFYQIAEQCTVRLSALHACELDKFRSNLNPLLFIYFCVSFNLTFRNRFVIHTYLFVTSISKDYLRNFFFFSGLSYTVCIICDVLQWQTTRIGPRVYAHVMMISNASI